MKITEFLQDNIIILDGGMGTLLQSRGLAPGELPERWNISHPDVITEIHRAYFDAGSNVVSTNTFGANSLKFSHGELEEIISAAIENARKAALTSQGTQEKWVALDVGPTGRMLKPYGDLDFEDAVAVFAETVRLGAKYGADLVIIETMNDSYETKAALLAAKESSSLPVFVSNAYGEDGKLMTGASSAAMVALLEGMGADAIGVNCSLGPSALAPVVKEYLALSSLPVIVKPNAGLPRYENGQTSYDVTKEQFCLDVRALVEAGARCVGGCCGTTPEYISCLAKELSGVTVSPIKKKSKTVISSYTHAVEFGDEPLLIGERINPTGKKLLRQALVAGDMDYVLKQGLSQQEKGVHILDVNVGTPDVDEAELLPRVICELQAIIELPLQIDTASPVAMERALRRYNGKPLINSVNGKKESMDAIFPLAKKYGGVVIALTLDENGIPKTAEERIEIAKKIIEEAKKYGIDKKDLVFDTLALTVSADKDSAKETLRALRMIRCDLGCHTSLGVSNVSFGLPVRELINGTFFALALSNGLSAAIMNPNSAEMQKTYYTYRALSGLDENFEDLIAFSSSYTSAEQSAPQQKETQKQEAEAYSLKKAVEKGLREDAASLARQLLQTRDPLEIIQNEIIPALNCTGEAFEKKTLFLPQLLMCAEAAKSAFEVIKTAYEGKRTSDCGTLVLATVHGDIHDIGKNIVKLLLENYGYDVVDLGKDVPPSLICDTVVKLHAPLVGLSALMTTTLGAMQETIELLKKNAPFCKIMVGGAVLTPEYAEKLGADGYAKDAMEAVRCADRLSSISR